MICETLNFIAVILFVFSEYSSSSGSSSLDTDSSVPASAVDATVAEQSEDLDSNGRPICFTHL